MSSVRQNASASAEKQNCVTSYLERGSGLLGSFFRNRQEAKYNEAQNLFLAAVSYLVPCFVFVTPHHFILSLASYF